MRDRLRQAHRLNAVIVGSFVALHFVTHLLAWGGIAVHTRGLELARMLYRMPVVEAILLAALLAQILTGLWLAFRRIRAGELGKWGILQVASGVLLALFILAHASANLSARFDHGLDTNFFWPAGTLVTSPANRYFYFHYTVPICALFAHIACALRFNGHERFAWRVLLAGPVAALIIVLPFSGALYPIELPDSHRAYLEAMSAPDH